MADQKMAAMKEAITSSASAAPSLYGLCMPSRELVLTLMLRASREHTYHLTSIMFRRSIKARGVHQ